MSDANFLDYLNYMLKYLTLNFPLDPLVFTGPVLFLSNFLLMK